MAGLPDALNPTSPTATIAQTEAQIGELDAARNAVRGIQTDTIRSLFDFDKSLSTRYSSPDSKMYLENAGDREKAISGYSAIAGGEINNLYDLTETIRGQREKLAAAVDELKKKAAGSGAGGFSPSNILGFLKSRTGADTESAPPPPKKLSDYAENTEGSQIFYAKNDDGTFSYVVQPPGVQVDTKIYKPYVPEEELRKQQTDEEDQILSQFGVDREQLSRLAALEVLDPKLAGEAMKQAMVQATLGRKLEKEDLMAGVKPYDSDKVRQSKLEKFYTEGGGADAETQKDIGKWKNITYLANRALDQYESGIKSREDEVKLASTMSQLASFYATGEGGKTLSENEWALIAGAVPQPVIKKANVWQRALGIVPPQSGKLQDTPEEARAKLESLIQTAGDKYGFLQGKKLPPTEAKNLDQNVQPFTVAPGEQTPLQEVVEGAYTLIAKPIVEGVKGYIKLLGSAGVSAAAPVLGQVMEPAAYDQLASQVEEWVGKDYASPTQTLVTGGLQTAGAAGAAIDLFTLGQGTTVKTLLKQAAKIGLRNIAFNAPIFGFGSALEAKREGLSDEEIQKRALQGILGQRFTGIFVGAFGDSPEAQAADITTMIVAPIVGQKIVKSMLTGDGLGKPTPLDDAKYAGDFMDMPKHEAAFSKAIADSNLDEARKIADSLTDGNPYKKMYMESIAAVENAPDAKPNTLHAIYDGKRAKMAAQIFAADPDSVVKSEELAQKAIKMTKSNDLYGMAKELPAVRQAAGKFVDANVGKLSEATGLMDRDEIVAIILDKIDTSSAAQSNPAGRMKVEQQLRALLFDKSVEMGSEMAQRGVTAGTTLNRMNDTRKTFNREIPTSWFSKGQPLTSAAEQIDAMKWIASSTIKDLIKDTDTTGRIAKAIDMEHVAFAVEPVISKMSLKQSGTGQFGGITTRLYNFIANSFASIMERGKIRAIRSSLGGTEGAEALGTAAEMTAARAAQEASGFTRRPLSPEMLDIITSNKAKKAPAQAVQFMQDVAGESGGLMGQAGIAGGRNAQDAALRRLRSVKYK